MIYQKVVLSLGEVIAVVLDPCGCPSLMVSETTPSTGSPRVPQISLKVFMRLDPLLVHS